MDHSTSATQYISANFSLCSTTSATCMVHHGSLHFPPRCLSWITTLRPHDSSWLLTWFFWDHQSYRIVSYRIVSYRIVSYRISSHRIESHRIASHLVLYCIVLYCIVLYCIVLYCIVLYCIVLYCIVLYCIVLYCIVLYCIVLYCIVLYCIVLYCIVLYCIDLWPPYIPSAMVQKNFLWHQSQDISRKWMSCPGSDCLSRITLSIQEPVLPAVARLPNRVRFYWHFSLLFIRIRRQNSIPVPKGLKMDTCPYIYNKIGF